jgi:hypothetical protein
MHKTALAQWLHLHVPFAAILATQEVGKRPLMTRVIENVIVGVAGGAIAAYVAINTLQAVHSVQITDIQNEIAQEHQDTVTQIQNLQMQISNVQLGVTATRNHQMGSRQ